MDLVENYNGTVMTTSLKIAEVFGKNHRDILRKIKEKQHLFNERNFALVSYTDNKEELRPMYLLDRDFASYLVMGFTGSKADEWKLKYINAFNKMEEKLKEFITEEEKLKLQLFSKDPLEVAAAHNKLVQLEIDAATLPLKQEIKEKDLVIVDKEKTIKKKEQDIDHKQEIIDGYVENVSLSGKRAIIRDVVRYNGANFKNRYNLLYKEFENKYHMNLNYRLNKYNENRPEGKKKIKSKLGYIVEVEKKTDELYDIAVKLFETDVKELAKKFYNTIKC